MSKRRSRNRRYAALIAMTAMALMISGCSAADVTKAQSTLIGVAEAANEQESEMTLQLGFSQDGKVCSVEVLNLAEPETAETAARTAGNAGAAGVAVLSMQMESEPGPEAWGVASLDPVIFPANDTSAGSVSDMGEDLTAMGAGVTAELADNTDDPDAEEAGDEEEILTASVISSKDPASKAAVQTVRQNVRKKAVQDSDDRTDAQETAAADANAEAEEAAQADDAQETKAAGQNSGIISGDTNEPDDPECSQAENHEPEDLSEAEMTARGSGDAVHVRVTINGVEVNSDYYTVTSQDEDGKTVVTVTGDGEHFQGSLASAVY